MLFCAAHCAVYAATCPMTGKPMKALPIVHVIKFPYDVRND